MRDGMREKGEERGNANESPWRKTENILSLHGKSMGQGCRGDAVQGLTAAKLQRFSVSANERQRYFSRLYGKHFL